MALSRTAQRAQALLIVVVVLASLYQLGISAAAIQELRRSTASAELPLDFGYRIDAVSGTTRESDSAGIHLFDVLEQVEGQPFTSLRVLERAVEARHAGDSLRLQMRRPDGSRYQAAVRLRPIRERVPSIATWIVQLAIQILLPVSCLILGFWVAAARPYDFRAWLLLFLMIGFSQFPVGFGWVWPLRWAAFVWNAALGMGFGAWLVWIYLFGIVFPETAPKHARRPWLRWIFISLLVLQTIFFFVFQVGKEYDFSLLRGIRPLLEFLLRFPVSFVLSFCAIGGFFAILGLKARTASTPDARRRLLVLYTGTSISLTPLFLLSIYSAVKGNDLLFGIPEWLVLTAILFLLLFPLTMAYVIVAQRAMNVSMVIRQGFKYALARRGLLVFRFVLVFAASWATFGAFFSRSATLGQRVVAALLLVIAVVLRRKLSSRALLWIDKRFFRESFSAEVVLSELINEAREFTDSSQLLATVAQRVAATLHVSRMAVFVKIEDRFCLSETIGIDPAAESCFSRNSRSVKLLTEERKAELVYFDDPRSWVHTAEADEQQKLRNLDAEVLLALPGRKELLGIIALGPKLSEEPYSPSDLRLLQSVAIQTGLALENSLLMATVARETATRERLNREIEIAREVQERLFPQSCPPVMGLDYFGHCRPALAVGGDYFDFIPRSNGRIGIALGDVSGKGISAALMMASLHSLMRGQMAAGLEDIACLITNTNRLIFEASTSNRYVTFFYGEYDPATMCMTFVNAGHNPPAILRGGEVLRMEACGPVVGLLQNVSYESCDFQFEVGDIFIAFTDGISEAMTHEDEEWGEERMIDAARCCCESPAAEMTAALMEAADAFTKGAPQHDDMTLIALKVSG